jgi:hypothetical protein
MKILWLVLVLAFPLFHTYAQDKPDTPKPKPTLKDPNFWAAEGMVVGSSIAMYKATNAVEAGIPNSAPDTLNLPHSHTWNAGVCVAGAAVATSMVILGRKADLNDKNKFWRFLARYGPAIAYSGVVGAGAAHKYATHHD